jgi:hypothetical protein
MVTRSSLKNEISPAYDKGEALGSDPTGRNLRYDMLGNLRTTNDIGALGVVSGSSQAPSTGLNVILEAPYENGRMKTTLSSSNVLPMSQPYNVNPWNINDPSKIKTIAKNYVDWILVQLRSDLSNTKYSKPAILTEDGAVLNTDGSSFSFSDINPGQYYVVIKHRNHLSIMSSTKVQINNNEKINYNFTDAAGKAYGVNPMVLLNDGKYAMFAGDGDINGSVNVLDFSTVANNILLVGYAQGDIDMNGSTNILDYSKINKNLLKVSNVP